MYTASSQPPPPRIRGMKRSTFWIVVGLILAVIVGAVVGGAVGGTVSHRKYVLAIIGLFLFLLVASHILFQCLEDTHA